MFARIRFLAVMLLAGLVASAACAQEKGSLRPGDRVAIIGDSITEQKLYSGYIEAYLLASSGVPDLKVFQYGWSGERADGFANRAENDLAGFKPTVATLCYGMNDGGYQPYRDEIGKAYENNMRNVVKKLQGLGVRTIVIGSPGAVDTDFFRPGQMMGDRPAHVAYNDNLAHLRDIDRRLADEFEQVFANVHDAMYEPMKKAKEKLGKEYPVCGRDGFHPGPNGQLLMAYAFLKALQPDGTIGVITVDLGGKPEATAGHKVSGERGSVEVESTRWPFCFQGDDKSPDGTRSITPFVPFNEELNRFVLKVKGLDAAKAKVTWGNQSREFSREELAEGVNLTAAFTETPIDASFGKLLGAIRQKQDFETYMIKQVITNFRNFPAELKEDAELQKALAVVSERLHARQQALDANVRAQLVPVKHTITVEPVR